MDENLNPYPLGHLSPPKVTPGLYHRTPGLQSTQVTNHHSSHRVTGPEGKGSGPKLYRGDARIQAYICSTAEIQTGGRKPLPGLGQCGHVDLLNTSNFWLICWLVGLWFGWMMCRLLTEWLSSWLVSWLVGWLQLFGWVVTWLVGWSVHW